MNPRINVQRNSLNNFWIISCKILWKKYLWYFWNTEFHSQHNCSRLPLRIVSKGISLRVFEYRVTEQESVGWLQQIADQSDISNDTSFPLSKLLVISRCSAENVSTTDQSVHYSLSLFSIKLHSVTHNACISSWKVVGCEPVFAHLGWDKSLALSVSFMWMWKTAETPKFSNGRLLFREKIHARFSCEVVWKKKSKKTPTSCTNFRTDLKKTERISDKISERFLKKPLNQFFNKCLEKFPTEFRDEIMSNTWRNLCRKS